MAFGSGVWFAIERGRHPMTALPAIPPINNRPVTPLSRDEWSEQFKIGALYPEVGTAAWFAEFNAAVYHSPEWWRMAAMESEARSKLPRGPNGQLGEFEAVKIESARISAELDAAKAEGRRSRIMDPAWQWNHEAEQ